ncbi:hypothetical protein EPN87_00195 [archaeon]|nr:MAG: hypothetical protein EPN87_00195 [archaeon]
MVSKLSEKVISNTTYLTLDWVIATVFSLLYWIIVGKFLSPENYGIVSTVNGLVPFVSMISMLGLSLAIMKLVPEYSVNQRNKIKPIVRFSLKIIALTNIAIAITFVAFSSQLSSIFKIDTVTVILSAIGIISMSFFYMSGSVIYGLQNMKKYFTSDLFGQIAKVIITISMMYFGFLFYGPVVGLIAGFAVSLIFRFDMEWLSGNSSRFDSSVLFEYAKPGIIFILISSVFTYYQYFILPIVQDQFTTGLFSVALRITTLISMVPAVLISGLFPVLSGLSAIKAGQRHQGFLVGSMSRYTLFAIVPLVAFSIIFAKHLVILFSQPQYVAAASLFPILAIASMIYGMGNMYTQALYAIKKPKIFRNVAIASLVTFVATSIPFAYFYSSFGLSISYLLSAFILFILSFIFLRKNVPLYTNPYSIIKIIIATAIFSLILIVSEFISIPLARVAAIILSFPAYIFVLRLLKFYNEQDVKILKFIGHKVPIVRRPLDAIADMISK